MHASPHHTKPTARRRVAYILVLLLLLMIIAELITSVFFYHQYGKRKLALVELWQNVKNNFGNQKKQAEQKQKNYHYQQLVRNGNLATGKAVVDETMVSNQMVYDPWLSFKNVDYAGQYINVSGFERKTIPQFIKGEKDTITIWFFGGSTMFGFSVTDAETIPSYYAQMINDSNWLKASVKIINYGIPYYYSYHEYKLLCHLLDHQPPPDLTVFMDGLNDYWNYQNSFYQQPYFTRELSGFMRQAGTNLLKSNPDGSKWLSSDTISKAQCDTLINNYLHTVSLIEKKAMQYNFRSLFVIQPVPFYQYDRQQQDPICSKNRYPSFEYIYPKLEQIFAGEPNKVFLGNLHRQAPPLPYIDACHYSPAFNKQIASVLLQRTIKQIPR